MVTITARGVTQSFPVYGGDVKENGSYMNLLFRYNGEGSIASIVKGLGVSSTIVEKQRERKRGHERETAVYVVVGNGGRAKI